MKVPRYIVWSTDRINTADPFQRRWLLRQILTHGRAEDVRALDMQEIRWLLRQILTHGRAEDVRALDMQEVERELETLDLPPHLNSLWKHFLESEYAR